MVLLTVGFSFRSVANLLMILARSFWVWTRVGSVSFGSRVAMVEFFSWFESVTLANRGCGGGITAWDGELGTTNGVYIANSKIIRVSSQYCHSVPDVRYLVTVT